MNPIAFAILSWSEKRSRVPPSLKGSDCTRAGVHEGMRITGRLWVPWDVERSRGKRGWLHREGAVAPGTQEEEGCPLNSFSSDLARVGTVEKGSQLRSIFCTYDVR